MLNECKFKKLGVMIDNSRNAVMKPEAIKRYIDILARLGYNCLMLYTEDTYEIKGRPYFGHNRGRFSGEELRDIDSYARQKGIELIPCIQTLAHVNAIFRWSAFNGVHDCNDILLCGEDQTYELIDDMFKAIAESFTSKTVNIGMDEAHMLGRGKYQDIHGFENRFDILMTHLKKVSEIAEKYDLELIMWGDMFFRLLSGGSYYNDKAQVPEEVKALVPHNVKLIYWDYYSHDKQKYLNNIAAHNAIKGNSWFAGGLWCWSGFAPHNTFSLKATEAAFSACIDQKVDNVFVTMWGDNGGECSRFSMLPSLYYASQLAKGITDIDTVKSGFEKEFGIAFDDYMLLELPDTPNGVVDIINSDKYLLYNDCFMGLFDNLVKESDAVGFKTTADRIERLNVPDEFAPIFESLKCLCRVLEEKTTLGIDTRKAYSADDKDAIAALLPRYDRVISLIEAFYTAYEKQWMWENKPHGFDVQDIRIGGLIKRISHCKKRLEEYISGTVERIEELEEPLCDAYCRKDATGHVCYNDWGTTATSNVI